MRGSYEVDPVVEAERSLQRRAEKYVGAICIYGHGEELAGYAKSLHQAAITYAAAVRDSEKKRRRTL